MATGLADIKGIFELARKKTTITIPILDRQLTIYVKAEDAHQRFKKTKNKEKEKNNRIQNKTIEALMCLIFRNNHHGETAMA